MRIVVACPSVLQDGANVRQQINAALCPYMVAMRGYLPPNNKDEPLIDITGLTGYARIWLVAQVWDVDQAMMKDLKASVSDRELQLRVVEEGHLISPAERTTTRRTTARIGAGTYVTSPVRDTIYAVSRSMSMVEAAVVGAGLGAAWGGSTAVLYPAVAGGGRIVHTHRSYRAGTDNNDMFTDVMQRIHETQRGNET